MPSASALAGCVSLPGEVTQNFIHEGCRSFVFLPEFGCCSFLLILITGHGSTTSLFNGSPVYQTYSFILPLSNSSSVSLGNQNQSHLSVKCFASLAVNAEHGRAPSGQVVGSAETLDTAKADLYPEYLI